MKRFEIFWRDIKNCLQNKVIQNVSSEGKVFNQYNDCNPDVDVHDAASIRKENLKTYLKRINRSTSVLIVGEAPSPWGARFSGIPFMGEEQVTDPQFCINGKRSSKTKNPPYCSKTDKIFWGIMMNPYLNHSFICWNAVPFHPHKLDDVMTVRNPTNKEVYQCRDALVLVKKYLKSLKPLKPLKIIAVGRKAEQQLIKLDENPIYVIHPSRRKTQFIAEMKILFEIQ